MFGKLVFGASILALGLALSSCGGDAGERVFLDKHGLDGKTPAQMVEHIDRLDRQRPLDFRASVTPGALILADGGNSYSYPLADSFYLSFAPYLQKTHPCFNHSLAACQGELPGRTFAVTIVDRNGRTLLDGRLSTARNGFIGVWLPREIEGVITVSGDGLSASAPFATGPDSPTCLTGLKLEQRAG